ncbi:MAG: 2-dehydropantoate 2-reductase [Gammaproteobacteria bacterium]|nr:2-dehydropantoate 2-reductase [Gammaproteobacteria bacterium]
MSKRVFFIGGGAVGAYTGGHMARAGVDVTLVDPWKEHVEKMRTEGLELRGVTPEETCTVKLKAMTPEEFQAIAKDKPVDIGIVSTKSYDTEWAVNLLVPALADDAFVVSLQNCINEDRIAAIVGKDRVAGCIASTISVELKAPGFVERSVPKRGDSYTVFRCGEYTGKESDRVRELVEWLKNVDSAKMTTNLMGERWSKLVINASHNGLSACTGYGSRDMAVLEKPRRLSIKLSGETIKVAKALGIELENIKGFTPDEWVAAADGDAETLARIEKTTIDSAQGRSSTGRPSMGQDIAKGRRTEIDYLNGLVVEKGKELGIPTPANEGIVAAVKLVESGKAPQDPKHIDGLV